MKTKKKSKKKGFTLIELLIVIAIIAILSVVVVLTLNPAEMLRRSRDSNRASDLSIIKTALSLYLADVSSTYLGVAGTCYVQLSTAAWTSTDGFYEFAAASSSGAEAGTPTLYNTAATNCTQWFAANDASTVIATSSRVVSASTQAGTGWIPVNLSLISSGAPISQWPADPSWSMGANSTGNGNAGHFYSYVTTSTNNQYKLAAKMESTLYSQGGSSDLESTDGGTDNFMYEQGTNLTF